MVMGELEQKVQVVVIGSGPGGYAAAFRAADLGLDVALVDTAPRPGGVCLFDGCIPSKTLLFLSELIYDARRAEEMGIAFGRPRIDLEKLRDWRTRVVDAMARGLVNLSRRRNVQLIRGRARFEDAHRIRLRDADIRRIVFDHAIIATGSEPIPFPEAPFTEDGRIMSSTGALALADVPRKLLIIGGGYVGAELGTVYAALGSRVSLVELGDGLLPGVDRDLVKPLQERLASQFEALQFNTRVRALESGNDEVQAVLGDGGPGQRFDRVLVAIGRRPATGELGLEDTRVRLDGKGFIQVDDRQRTDEPSIFAVGDATGGLQLAHKASRQGKVAAEVIAGKPSAFDARAIPAVVYTDPQIAWCGLTEAAARRQQIDVEIQRFPWKYSGRAATMGATEGLTKIIVDRGSGRIIGAGMAGRDAEGLISEAVLAIEMGALAEDLALSIHPHPTLAETVSEAAELYLGNATHLLRPGE
jgi:dihydrolipoamide dehydrogenase